jgi:hypothetical protein
MAVAVLALVIIARFVANVDDVDPTFAQSPRPTSTFTPTPLVPTPTDTPEPPTPTPSPLVCSDAAPSSATLWPPNGRFVAVNVLGVSGGQGDSTAITIDSIRQDEPVDSPGSGSAGPDGWGVGTATARARAERDGRGNGRVYHIAFTADDGDGGTCSGEVLVGVPRSIWRVAIDDGPLYDSTAVSP